MVRNIVSLWYWIGAPAPVSGTASFDKRETVRRGRAASWILLIVLLLDVLPIPGVLNKPSIVIILLVVFGIDFIALLFNRGGKIRTAGVLTILTTLIGLVGTLLSVPGGATAVDLPLFDLMLEATVVAAAMISPVGSLVVTLINGAIIWFVLHLGTLSPGLESILQARGFTVLLQAWQLQVIIGIFLYIITKSALEALKRADRAEEIEKLQRLEIERQEEHVQRENMLNMAIEQILGTLQTFNNGDWNAKVPVERDHILFRVAYSINNLLARLSRSRQAEQELAQSQQEIHTLRIRLQALQNARTTQAGQTTPDRTNQALAQLANAIWSNKLPTESTGTPVDEIIVALRARDAAIPKETRVLNNGGWPEIPSTPYPRSINPSLRENR
jgi:type II secretory pathway pseudopilin PulG